MSGNEENTVSEVELKMIANLYAAMTCADGIVRDIENFTSEAFLENYDSADIQKISDHYYASIKNYSETRQEENIQDLVFTFNEEQKLKILRSLCAIAGSDGVVHPTEQVIIDKFIKAMKLSEATINFLNQKERH